MGDDLVRFQAVVQYVYHEFVGFVGDFGFGGVLGWDEVRADWVDVYHFECYCYCVGGELVVAGVGFGVGGGFDVGELLVGDFVCGVGVDGFEHVYHCDVFVFVVFGWDRAVVEYY